MVERNQQLAKEPSETLPLSFDENPIKETPYKKDNIIKPDILMVLAGLYCHPYKLKSTFLRKVGKYQYINVRLFSLVDSFDLRGIL